jgi:hypothetical protein
MERLFNWLFALAWGRDNESRLRADDYECFDVDLINDEE